MTGSQLISVHIITVIVLTISVQKSVQNCYIW